MNSTVLPPGPRRWALLGIGLSVLLFTVDLSIVNVALPTLVRELHTSYATVQWVVLSYLLVIACFLMGAARLGDLQDKKKLFLIGLAVFTLGSLMCGAAPDVSTLIAFRALQGLGAVFTSALGTALVTEISPPEERGKNLGIVGGIISIGVALGPTLGGLLLSAFSWRSIFLVNVPIGLMAGLAIQRVLPSTPYNGTRGSFDWTGMTLLGVALVGFCGATNSAQQNGLAHPFTLGALATAALAFPLFVLHESRQGREALVDLQLLANRRLALSLSLAVAVFIVLAGSLFLMPFFLELVLGYDVLKVGLLLAVAPVAAGLVAPLAGTLSDRYGERPVSLVGLACLTVACGLISGFHVRMTEWRYVIAYVPLGLGVGIFQAPNNSAVMGSVPDARLGTASGLLSLSRILGQSTGIPLLATLFYAIAHGGLTAAGGGDIQALSPAALASGVRGTFGAACVMLGLCTAVGTMSFQRVFRGQS